MKTLLTHLFSSTCKLLIIATGSATLSLASETRQVPKDAIFVNNSLTHTVALLLLPSKIPYRLKPGENQSFACPPVVTSITINENGDTYKVECGKQYVLISDGKSFQMKKVVQDRE